MNGLEKGKWFSKPSTKEVPVKKMKARQDEFAYGFMD